MENEFEYLSYPKSCLLKGAAGMGVPWDQIMENEFEYLSYLIEGVKVFI